ncbi:malto-oligosyltrehalose trehalohydrolase [Pedobacter sp. PWIIR3]
MHLPERNIGVNFDRVGQAHVLLWAPRASQVAILFGSQQILLQPQEHGYWYLETDLLIDGDKYHFLVDNEKLPDPASLAQPEGVHGPSQALNMHLFDWEDSDWRNHPLNEYMIYELHTGTFSPEGDFDGIINRLEHLVNLGITAIELMPVASFPGTRNWGYDGVFPFAVQNSYGGALGLRNLVNACHAKGIAVILDVVYNHLGPEGNQLEKFGPYFTDQYQTPWGNAVNFDDRGSDAVRNFFIDNALMWFRDFHVDALRLDAVHAIKDFSAVHILQEISRKTDILMAQTGRVHYLIAESDLNDPKYITDLENGGYGMDAQWVDEFHHALRVTAGQEKSGYYSDFSGIEHLAKSFKDAYVYTGMFSTERDRTFGKAATAHPGKQFIVFSQNHDQIGNRMLGERTSELVSFEMLKVMAAAVCVSPFLPMFFQGEEWGETNPFQYFVSHTDAELIEMVRKGRREEFAAMHSGGEAPDPQALSTFNNSMLNWDLLQQQKHASLFRFYQDLIALRKNQLALKMCDRQATHVHLHKAQECLVIERGLTGSANLILCVLNFSGKAQVLPLPTNLKDRRLLLDSNSNSYSGVISNSLLSFTEHSIHIQPESFIAYSATYV